MERSAYSKPDGGSGAVWRGGPGMGADLTDRLGRAQDYAVKDGRPKTELPAARCTPTIARLWRPLHDPTAAQEKDMGWSTLVSERPGVAASGGAF